MYTQLTLDSTMIRLKRVLATSVIAAASFSVIGAAAFAEGRHRN